MTNYYSNSLYRALTSIYPNHQWKSWKFTNARCGIWHSLDTQREFFDFLSSQIDLTHPQQYYLLRARTVSKNGGAGLLSTYYSNSPSRVVLTLYPELPFRLWDFDPIPFNIWKEEKRRREFLDYLAHKLRFSSLDSFYSLTRATLTKYRGIGILSRYRGKLPLAISSLYPHHHWHMWKFNTTPPEFWKKQRNLRAYFDWLREILEYSTLSDFYSITQRIILDNSGTTLLQTSGNSYSAAIILAYPEHSWAVWKFNATPLWAWDSVCVQREFVEWLCDVLETETPEDFYPLLPHSLRGKEGYNMILKLYSGSVPLFLSTVYPEHEWEMWKFHNTPKLEQWQWSDKKCQERFFLSLHHRIGVERMEDWYKLSISDVLMEGGMDLLRLYNDVPAKALMSLYSHHDWQFWRFSPPPPGAWTSVINRRKFIEWLGGIYSFLVPYGYYSLTNEMISLQGGSALLHFSTKYYNERPVEVITELFPEIWWDVAQFLPSLPLEKEFTFSTLSEWLKWGKLQEMEAKFHIKKPEDWLRVTASFMKQKGGATLFHNLQDLIIVLKQFYPDFHWSLADFVRRNKKSTQFWLLRCFRSILRGKVKLQEDFIHPQLIYQSQNSGIELDVYIEDYAVAFEYQGVQHYEEGKGGFWMGALTMQDRDNWKKAKCAGIGISLIDIPHWWENDASSLAATVFSIRPDIPLVKRNKRMRK